MTAARIARLTLLSASMLSLPILSAATRAYGQSGAAQQPDNSGRNKQQAKTADNQPNAKDDRLTTQKVRRAIVADKDLSTYAHNVKIITQGGMVTLKGPVKSADEKQKVVAEAAGVVSQDKIVDQLTVKQ